MISHYLREVDILVNFLDLLSIDNHIILVNIDVVDYLVFPRRILRPTGLLVSWISLSISCSLDVELVMKTTSLVKKSWDKYSLSILKPLLS